MKILAIDLSSPSGSMALLDSGAIAGQCVSPATVAHSAWLPGAVKDFLGPLGISLDDIDIFATTVGPGSFTGTRVAVSTIKGLAWPLGRKVYGASTLKAIARNIDTSGAVCALLDARKGEVYAAAYRRKEDGGLDTVMEERVLAPQSLAGELERLGVGPAVFTGDGVRVSEDAIKALDNGHIAQESEWGARAAVVARMASEDASAAVGPELLNPVYLRKPGSVFKKPGKAK